MIIVKEWKEVESMRINPSRRFQKEDFYCYLEADSLVITKEELTELESLKIDILRTYHIKKIRRKEI
jgi:hypothetical protein